MNYNSHGNPNDEQNAHIEISKKSKFGIVEIGVLNGDTSKNILSATKIPVYGIDPIIPDSMNISLIGNEEKIRNLEAQYKNYTFIKDYSYNVIKTWNKEIDYIFIDGSHYYDDVKKDFNDWFQFVVINGYISIHDSAMYRNGPNFWEGPSKLADQLLSDNRLEYVDTIFCMTIFKKITNEKS